MKFLLLFVLLLSLSLPVFADEGAYSDPGFGKEVGYKPTKKSSYLKKRSSKRKLSKKSRQLRKKKRKPASRKRRRRRKKRSLNHLDN